MPSRLPKSLLLLFSLMLLFVDGPHLTGQESLSSPEIKEVPLPLEQDPTSPRVSWLMPQVGEDAAPFSWLKGEDQSKSRSVGTTSHGFLVGAKRLHFPHPHLALLEVQGKRHLNYTSGPMLTLLEKSAAQVAATYPKSVTYLGNLGKEGGGDIFYSVSHNSGRDADVAFFVTNAKGESAQMWDLLPLDEEGKYINPEDETQVFVFDVPRNWALIKALVQQGEGLVQLIFVADWLRDAMLQYAKTKKEPASLINKVRALLRQPRVTLPHNDHFHIRIYCSPHDVSAGCKNNGIKHAGFKPHTVHKLQAIKQARMQLSDADSLLRLGAIRRLALLDDRASSKLLIAKLQDPDARVRLGAIRALGGMNKGKKELQKHWANEQEPEVVAEMIRVLADFKDRRSLSLLTQSLSEPKRLSLIPHAPKLDQRILIVDALATTESPKLVKPLIALLESSQDPKLRAHVAHALGLLTNHRFLEQWELASAKVQSDAVLAWKQWFKKYGRLSRARWVLEGFKVAGYPIKGLTRQYVWSITRAIDAPRHLSYNAQRVLIGISKNASRSLEWSKEDASFYWRRWFERRRRVFGLSKAPADLTTLVSK